MCVNCRDLERNACTSIVSSDCISWQGMKVEELDICLNDSLTFVINSVLSKIKEFLKGKGIILDELSLEDCTYLSGLLGSQEKSLLNIIKIYKSAICAIKDNLDDQNALIASFTTLSQYTLGCIAPLVEPCNSETTFKTLIQAILTKLCEFNTQFENLGETLLEVIEEGTGNFLIGGAIKSCGNNGIVFSGVGASAVVTFQALVPPNCPIIYTGSTSNFDSNGIGLPNSAYCGWYLCNGNNGTPNRTSLPQNSGDSINYIIRFN